MRRRPRIEHEDLTELVLSHVHSGLTCYPDVSMIRYDPLEKDGLEVGLRGHAVRWLDREQVIVTLCGGDDPERIGVLEAAFPDGLVVVGVTRVVLRTVDYPTFTRPGVQRWAFQFRLEDGVEVVLQMGRESRDKFRGFLLHEELDDAADQAARDLT